MSQVRRWLPALRSFRPYPPKQARPSHQLFPQSECSDQLDADNRDGSFRCPADEGSLSLPKVKQSFWEEEPSPPHTEPSPTLNPKLPQMMVQMLVHQYGPLLRR
jgi:hypothetical protein